MRARTILFLGFTVIAAGGTYYLAQNWILAQRGALTRVAEQEAPKLGPTALVLVADAALSSGQFIKEKDLRWRDWPKTGLSKAYYVKGRERAKNAAKDGKTVIENFVGAVVRTRILPGEPITEGRIVRPGDRGFLAAVLQPGTRAISVPINATTGISGFVFPGDRVDLLLTHTIDEGKRDKQVRRASETVLSDIRVLAVDQRTDDIKVNKKGKAKVAKTATLEVTPKQAEIIAVSSEIGVLSLSLRSLAQEEPQTPKKRARRKYTWDTEASRLIPRQKSAASGYVVKVFRGGEVTATNFDKIPGQGYRATGVSNLQPAARKIAVSGVSAPRNLLEKVTR